MKKQRKENNTVNDPSTVYYTRPSLKFSSTKEQEEENYRYWISLTPIERIQNVVQLIKKIFSTQFKIAKRDNRIHFDRP